MRILAPAHLSATGFGRVSGLVKYVRDSINCLKTFFSFSAALYLVNKVSINLMLQSNRTLSVQQGGQFWLESLLTPRGKE